MSSRTYSFDFLVFALLSFLVGCHSSPTRQGNPPEPKPVLKLDHTEPGESSASKDCGLTNYPVSRPNWEVLADVPPDAKEPTNSSMLAKLAIDKGGKVTHVRVLRLAHPNAPNWKEINIRTLQDIEHRNYKPTLYQGKPVVVCADVDVTIDLY